MKILVFNAGSSTLKVRLFDVEAGDEARGPAVLWRSDVEWRGRRAGDPIPSLIEPLWTGTARMLTSPGDLAAVGHRVVHGGAEFRGPTRVTPEVRDAITRFAVFAPEHNPVELEVIDAAELIFGDRIPQIAVFDTAFHRTLPLQARIYPVPFEWYEAGVQRYGFHGISHGYVSRRAATMLGQDPGALGIISCHLGNGASLAAVRGGASVDTTMGFTPLEGLMMGTRSGSIDPGILIHMERDGGYDVERLDQALNQESGLKGLSGISGDMREIVAAMTAGHERARLAFEVYVHRLVREIGAMAASLGGVDVLVFTAGIGENCAPLREAVAERLAFLGVLIDQQKNARATGDAGDVDVAAPDSAVRILVIATREEAEIARECQRLMASAGG